MFLFRIILLYLLAPFQFAAANVVSGTVFDDLNQNGIRNQNEKGVKNALISNGRAFVKTDRFGRYKIEALLGDAIMLVKPRDYRLPQNQLLQPQFFQWYGHPGSAHLKYGGMQKQTPPRGEINFALHSAKESNQFKILLFGDPQPRLAEEIDFYTRDIVDPLLSSASEYRFGLSLGDIVSDDLSLHQGIIERTAKLKRPWFYLPGNHDLDFDAPNDLLSDDSYQARFGPATYAFQSGRAHFIVLDDVLYEPKEGKPWYNAGLRPDQFLFIENYLKQVDQADLLVLVAHIPFRNNDKNNPVFRPNDQQKIFDLLAPFPNRLLLSAHSHTVWHHFFAREDGWHGQTPLLEFNVGATCGGFWSGRLDESGIPDASMSDGTPNGYVVMHINGTNFRLQYHAARDAKHSRYKVYVPKVVEQFSYPTAILSLNFYLGNLQKPVEVRIDQGKWEVMRLVAAPDPDIFSNVLAQDRSTNLLSGGRVGEPMLSPHIWKYILPTNLAVGEHQIEIKGQDIFAEPLTIQTTYKIETR